MPEFLDLMSALTSGVGRMVTSGSLVDVMFNTLTQNASGMGSIPALRNISHFHHFHDTNVYSQRTIKIVLSA